MSSEITEINKETFWQFIEEMKKQYGQDMKVSISWIKKELLRMPPEQSLQFHAIMHGYRDAANKYGLWTAATLIKEYGCSDDGFIDFRAWLIAQGKEVYMNALRDPDTLADIEPYGDCCFECLSYVGDYAYEQLTGRSAYDEMEPDRIEKMRDELKKDIVYKNGIQYPREPKDLPRFLPRLCEKYGGPERFLAAPSTWNYDLHEIRRLLDEGKVQDMATKKEKGGGAR